MWRNQMNRFKNATLGNEGLSMRDRYFSQERSGGNGATLDKLNDALQILESRIGIAQQSAGQNTSHAGYGDLDDVTAIRRQQAALNQRHGVQQPLPAPQYEQPARPRANASRSYPMNHTNDFDALRDEIRSLKQSNIDSAQDEARLLRSEIDQLKQDITLLAREDSVRQLTDRWGVVEREIASLPEQLASRDDLAAMAGRLDTIYNTLSGLPGSDHVLAMENQVRTLAAAMEQMASQQAAVSPAQMNAIEQRLSDMADAISAMPEPNGDNGMNQDALDRIEARIASIAKQIDEHAKAPANDQERDYTPYFQELSDGIATLSSRPDASMQTTAQTEALFADIMERIDFLSDTVNRAAPQEAVLPDDVLAAFEQRIAAIGAQLENVSTRSEQNVQSAIADKFDALMAHMQAVPAASASGVSEQMIADIANRIDEISSLVQKAPSASAGIGAEDIADVLDAQLDHRMEELARRIDERVAQPVAMPSLEGLEARLSEITALLNRDHEAQRENNPAIDLAPLENQIAQLSQRLSGVSAPASDGAQPSESDVFAAASMAAQEAVDRMIAQNGSAPDDITHLSQDLKALEELARDADGRNSRTFEAIHDTLLKVVDHLSGLEESLKTAPVRSFDPATSPLDEPEQSDSYETRQKPRPSPAPSSTMQPPLKEAPSMSVYDGDDEGQPLPVNADTPAPTRKRMHVDDAPSLDSFDEPVTQKPASNAALTPAQAAASAAIAALNDISVEGDRRAPLKETEKPKSLLKSMAQRFSRSKDASAGEEDANTLDEPFDDANRQTEVDAIMARVRRERDGLISGTAASGEAAKSDFIAAARRAAQAAAADASIAGTGEKTAKANGAGLTSLLSTKRKPILIGAGAVLLALLALPLMRGLLAPSDQATDLSADNNAPFQETMETVEQPAPLELGDETVRIVGSQPQALEVGEDQFTTDDDDGAQEFAEEGTFGEETLDAGSAATNIDQMQTSALPGEIPSDAGSVAMREAAAAGDAKAIFLIGDYYSRAAAGVEPDLATALQWYESAADKGYAPAQHRVGSFYEKAYGTERDLQTAKVWYERAAEQGNAAAMHNLAVLYANGVEGDPDVDTAARWFLTAAELGITDSQYNLGVMAVRGDGIAKSLTESYKWFSLAAQAGDSDAGQKRDAVAERLDPESLEMAKGAVALWEPKSLQQEANIISIPEAWRTDAMQTAAAPADVDMKKAVSNIQAILNANGFDAGPVDGVMGAKTRNAIKAFQSQNGMAATGNVDQALVQKLLETTKPAG